MPAAEEVLPPSTMISRLFDISAKRFYPPIARDHPPAVAFDAASSGNAVNQVQFSYNDFGQSIQTFQAHGGLLDDGTVNTGTTPSVQRGYANGSSNTVRPLSLTYPNGRELTYDYGSAGEINDALSRIGSIVDDDTTHLADYEFLGLAGVIQQTSPQPNLRYTLAGTSNDPDTGDIYTGLDRFSRVKDSRWYNTSTSDDLSRIQYGYDRASNRIWRKNPIATANSAEYDWLYTYDGLQRLKTANRGILNGTQTALTSTAFKQDWNLDPTSNWEGFKQSDNGSTWSMEQERTANPVNEITDITNTVGSAWADPAYNAVGNMTTIPKPKQMDEAYTATYDAWNRLVKLEEEVSSTLETVAEYHYDARNFRIVVKNYDSGVLDETTHTYFTDGWQNLEERTGSNSTPSQHHLWGLRYIDDLILRDRTTTTTLDERLYALQDANWNVTTIVDDAGDVQERFEYDPYGSTTILSPAFSHRSVSSFDWNTTYCGYQWDNITSLLVVRYRLHHTMVGAWLSRDPIGYEQQQTSLITYVRSSPLRHSDPFGLREQTTFDYMANVYCGFHQGLLQGVADIANGAQDSVIGLCNLPSMTINGACYISTGNHDVAPYIPSPDWSHDLLVSSQHYPHDINKFVGGEALITVVTCGAALPASGMSQSGKAVRGGSIILDSFESCAAKANPTSGTRVRKVGNYFIKEVNNDAPTVMRYLGKMELSNQAETMSKLADMSPSFMYKNGKLVARDAGEFTGNTSDWFAIYMKGSHRIGPFNDIRARNIGANGHVFDPVNPLHTTMLAIGANAVGSSCHYTQTTAIDRRLLDE